MRRIISLAFVSCLPLACTQSHDVVAGWEPESDPGSERSPAAPGDRPSRVDTGVGTISDDPHDPRDPESTPPAAAGPRGRGADPNDYIFSQDALRNYDVEVDPAEWARINEEAYFEEYIPGRLRFEGRVYEIGLRFKGFRGSLYNCFDFDENGVATGRTCSRLPLKISFDEYDEEARFFGLKKLNFHVMRNDISLMRDRLGYFLFRAFGVPAPRAVHATMSVNGEALGLFALVEEIDGRFARHAFEDGGEGNIYKERWPTLSSDADYYRSGLEANKDNPDVTPMQDFARALESATDDTIEAVLREHTNFDAVMRYLAVDRAINHWDGPLAFRCRPLSEVQPLPPEVELAQRPALGWEVCQNKNYYWYEETGSGRLQLVPWDLDVTFASFSQFPDWTTDPRVCEVRHQGRPPRCDKLVNWFATTLRPEYEQMGRELLVKGPFRREIMVRMIEGWYQQILPHTDPITATLGSFSLNSEIDRRIRDFAREVLP